MKISITKYYAECEPTKERFESLFKDKVLRFADENRLWYDEIKVYKETSHRFIERLDTQINSRVETLKEEL